MRPVLVLALLLLAGCSGTTEETSSTPPSTTTSSTREALVEPVEPLAPPPYVAFLVDNATFGHEPTVVVTKNGTILVHARSVQHGVSQPDPDSRNVVWRKPVGGNFTRVGTEEMEAIPASEGTIAVLESGRILAALSRMTRDDEQTLHRAVDIHASDDDGITWRKLASLPLPSAHRTWLWPGAGDTVHLGVLTYHPTFHYLSNDGGATWGSPTRVYDYNTYNGRLVGHGSTLLWPWFTGVFEQVPGTVDRMAPWSIDAVVSKAGGQWVPHRIATLEGGRGSVFAGATVDAAGTFYVTWAQWHDSGSSVVVAHSTDGATWSTFKVADAPGLRVMPWIDSPATGHVNLVWYQNDGYSGDPLNATGPWYAQFAKVTNATGTPSILVERAIADPIQEGRLCIQAFTCGDVVRNGRVCFAQVAQLACHDLDDARYYDDYAGLTHDAQGRAVMGFVATMGFGLPPHTPGEPGHVIVVVENPQPAAQ
jgi:hypothetical protein